MQVTNTGARAGSVVVQVYVQDPVMDFVRYYMPGTECSSWLTELVADIYLRSHRPWKRLVGFSKISIEAGQSQTVTVPVTFDEMSIHDADFSLKIIPGVYLFSMGQDSLNDHMNTVNVTLPGN